MTSLIVPASLAALALTVSYALTCITWPFGPCRRCQGTGLRLRYGRRLWNYLARLNRDAHK